MNFLEIFKIKYPKNDEEFGKINTFFIKCRNYYYQSHNLDNNSKINTFNILVCWTVSFGKSTFIGQFMQDKITKEGKGLSVTYNIRNYLHPKYPIKIIDTPGFENYNKVQITKKIYWKIRKRYVWFKQSYYNIFYLIKQKKFLFIWNRFHSMVSQRKKLSYLYQMTMDFSKKEKSLKQLKHW